MRDYVYVTDLADAHVQALGYLLDGNGPIALNLGTGLGHSVREIIRAVERVEGVRVPTREGPRRPGDPPALVADPSQARYTYLAGNRCCQIGIPLLPRPGNGTHGDCASISED
jgi:UDP-glucose 4-epimerase